MPAPVTPTKSMSMESLPLPILFQSNAGQWPEQVAFKADMAGGYSIWFEKNSLLIDARGTDCAPMQVVLSESSEASVLGETRSQHFSNYYLGNDSSKWHVGVPSWSSIRYHNVAPGVDLVFYSNSRHQLEFDYELAPGAQLSSITRQFIGADSIIAGDSNNLSIYFAGRVLHEKIPVSYAEHENYSTPITAGYVVDAGAVKFATNDDEESRRVVDPVLFFSAYVGGILADRAAAIKADVSNGCWIVGSSSSTNYPLLLAGGSGSDVADPNAALDGPSDAVVTRISGNGNALLWSTYIGGSFTEEGFDLAFDAPTTGFSASTTSDIYITGRTNSNNFPTYPSSLSSSHSLADDVFITKLTGSFGRLVWSRYYGGIGNDRSYGIAVSASGRTFVAGSTNSSNLPNSATGFPTRWQGVPDGNFDGFAASFSQTGTLEYSTYLNGGSKTGYGDDFAFDVAMSNDTAYIVGATRSPQFAKRDSVPFNGIFKLHPDNVAPFEGLHAYVLALNETGSYRPFATFLGKTPQDTDLALCVTTGNDGNIWVGGVTLDDNFMQQFLPGDTLYTYQKFAGGGSTNGWLIRFNHRLEQDLSWTFLGGQGTDAIVGIQRDDLGNVFVCGSSASQNETNIAPRYPLVDASSGFNGADNKGGSGAGNDGFVAQFSNTGKTLHFFSFIGGTDEDQALGIAYGVNGRAMACGLTSSTGSNNFPRHSPTGSFSWPGSTYAGGTEDAFVTAWDCCVGARGNVDGSEAELPDIGDLSYLVDFLFITFQTPPCLNESNIDGVGAIDIADLSLLVDNLFISFNPLPNCP